MSVSDEDLERYFDGELDEAARRRVEAGLDDDDRARLEAMADVRAALKSTLSAEAEGIDLTSALADALAKERGRVVPLARPKRRFMRLASTGAGLLVAAAAAFLFVVRPWGSQHGAVNNAQLESLDLDGVSAVVFTVDGHKANDSATILLTMVED